jgi:hypothetical protein
MTRFAHITKIMNTKRSARVGSDIPVYRLELFSQCARVLIPPKNKRHAIRPRTYPIYYPCKERVLSSTRGFKFFPTLEKAGVLMLLYSGRLHPATARRRSPCVKRASKKERC